MKTVITSTGNNPDSKFDLRFGRSGWFCIYDSENGSIQFIENENKNLNGGAGTKSAEAVAEFGIESVISGDFGPKAKTLLEELKIKMIILNESNLTVQDVINSIKTN
ncbi:MAG: dinitrogenase iron-molybdenum cofactor biosynthesis protein [Prolixibacteraceae bacterium]|nr:dinitrogenase iron-molybdenum cofactor biosynthesis protein [Prolixibacteraceae bacterium]